MRKSLISRSFFITIFNFERNVFYERKKYITAAENAQKDNIPEDCRYTYFARTVVVDGAKYPVISAIPIASSELRIDCAEDKILQLITGEKK